MYNRALTAAEIHAIFDAGSAGKCNPVPTPVPTVSQWGLIVLTLLLLTAGTIVMRRHRPAVAVDR